MFGLDPTLMTMIFSAAVAACASAAYYLTKQGIPKLDLAQQDIQSIATGFMKGTLHTDDLTDIMQCMANPKETVESIEFAIQTLGKEGLEMQDVMISLQTLGITASKFIQAVRGCDSEVTNKEIEILTKMVDSFKEPKTLAYKIGTNIVVNGVDIYKEMQAAYTSYLGKDYETFGRDVGVSMTLIFIGASAAAKLDPEAAKVMESIAEGALYPDIHNVYDSNNNAQWIEYLHHIAKSEHAAETTVPNYNAHLINLVAQPARIDQQTYMSLINLMSQQQQVGYLY